MSIDLPPTPQVKCSDAQPVCNGQKANSYQHADSTTAVGDKRKPSNEEAAAITDAANRMSTLPALAASAAVAFILSMI
ncbi:hypothetical protein PInf_019060 [Phytophthora infestans]|nr:hypothetical protein PInf_019060 [Phytophthora infestans]